MPRYAGRLAAAALLTGAWAADRSAAQPPPLRQTGLIDAMLAPKPEPKPEPEAKPEGPRKPATARAAKDAADERAKEQADYLRRLAVCDKLRELAFDRQDDALSKQADALEEQAREVYARRTAHLPVARVAPARPAKWRDEDRAATAELVDSYLSKLPADARTAGRREGPIGPGRDRSREEGVR